MDEEKITSKKIFISYGRKDAQELAFKLDKDLKKEGHIVWLDKREIEPGEFWEQEIEDGILNAEIFIALLSPHAVRRPNGVCLDEISMARYNDRKIIPAMVLTCRPPLGIYRLDWVDFRNWEVENQYNNSLKRLLETLKKDVIAEGVYSRIFSKLKPMDFGIEITKHIHDFTGREWLLNDLDKWLKSKKSRVFFITGNPGTGKSAIMAYLVHRHQRVVACHFCVNYLKESLSPSRFIQSIAAQLATQLENYRGALEGVDLDRLIDFDDPGTLMRRLIIDPLKAEYVDKPVLLIVDGLDEALTQDSSNIITLLREQLDYLPVWMKIVISSRKKPKILNSFIKFKQHEIEATRPENIEDIKIFLKKRLKEPEIAKIISEKGADIRDIIKTMSKKGEGNFLYVKETLEAIKDGSIDPLYPETFPNGLIGIYTSFFERLFPKSQDFDEIRPIMNVILAAREPLTAKQIGYFLDRNVFGIRKNMQRLASFFPERNNCYQAYHKSLVDWLLGEAGQDLTYQVDVESGFQCITEKLLSSYQEGNINTYLLKHLPQHLLVLKKWETLDKILTDLTFIKEKCSIGMLRDLLNDYESVEISFPNTERTDYSAFRELLRRVLRLSSVDINMYLDQVIPHIFARLYGIENKIINEILHRAIFFTKSPWLKALVPCLNLPNDLVQLQWQAYQDSELAMIQVEQKGQYLLSIDIKGITKYWELHTGQELTKEEGEIIFKNIPSISISKKSLINRWTNLSGNKARFLPASEKIELTTSDKSYKFYSKTTLAVNPNRKWISGIHRNLYSLFKVKYNKNKYKLSELDQLIDEGDLSYSSYSKGRIKYDVTTSMLLTSDEKFLLTGNANGKIIIWDLPKIKEIIKKPKKEEEEEIEEEKEIIIEKKEIIVSNSSIVTLALTVENQIVFGTTDGKIGITKDNVPHLRETEIVEINSPINLDDKVTTLILTPEGRHAICVNRQGLITKWETSTGHLMWKIEPNQFRKWPEDLALFKTYISSDYNILVIEFVDLEYGGGIGLIGINLQTAECHLIIDPDDSPHKSETHKRIERDIDSILKDNYGNIFDKSPDAVGDEKHKSNILTRIPPENKRMLNVVDTQENLITRFIFEEPLDKAIISNNSSIVACASIYGELYFLELRLPNS